MVNYKKKFATHTEAEEYAFVSLAKCVFKDVLKYHNGDGRNYSVSDFKALIKKSKWYDGILDDCQNLGLDTDEILNALVHHLKFDSIWEGIQLIHANKVHVFEAVQFGTKPFVCHRFYMIPPEEVATLKKGGI